MSYTSMEVFVYKTLLEFHRIWDIINEIKKQKNVGKAVLPE